MNLPLFEQYALALLWRDFASGDPMEDLGLAVQAFMTLNDFGNPRDAVLAGRLAGALAIDDEEEDLPAIQDGIGVD